MNLQFQLFYIKILSFGHRATKNSRIYISFRVRDETNFIRDCRIIRIKLEVHEPAISIVLYQNTFVWSSNDTKHSNLYFFPYSR